MMSAPRVPGARGAGIMWRRTAEHPVAADRDRHHQAAGAIMAEAALSFSAAARR